MRSKQSEKVWQPGPAWQAKFLGFGSAWWLALAPYLLGWLPGAPAVGRASVLGKVVSGVLRLSHPALLACVLISLCLWVGCEPGAAKNWGKWFLLGVLLMAALATLFLLFLSFTFRGGA